MRHSLFIGFCLLLVFFASSWALFRSDFFRTHDYIHGARIAEMTRALQDGHFPPRWSANFGYGYGMPLFQFYAPLPYFVGALFFMAGVSLVWSVKSLFILSNLVTLALAYKLGTVLYNKWAGLVLAAALTLAPYRAVNLFVRGAISETWGMMGMLLAVLGIVLVVKKTRFGLLPFYIGIITIGLSHNLSLIMFGLFAIPVLITLLLTEYLSTEKKLTLTPLLSFLSTRLKSIAFLGISGALALLTSSFYLIPMFFEKEYTHVSEAVTGGFFNFRLHFLYFRQFFVPNWGYGGSVWGPEDDISFFLGYGQLVLSGVAVGASLAMIGRAVFRRQMYNKLSQDLLVPLFFGGLTVSSLLLATFKSKYLWELSSVFSYLQFPWRWIGLATLFLAVVAAAATQHIKHKQLQLVAAVGAVIILSISNFEYFQPEEFLADMSSFYYDEPSKIQKDMSGVLYDYVPNTIPLITTPPTENIWCVIEQSKLVACNSARLLTAKTHTVSYEITSQTEQEVVLAIADFPGWQMYVNGVKVEKGQFEGKLFITLDAGTHTVTAVFENTEIRSRADWLSVVGMILSSVFFIGVLRSRSGNNPL